MSIIEDLLIPYVGPGCCHNKNCQFYWYEFYHMPTESCPDWESLQKELISEKKYSSKFNLHEFMDYAAHEIKWRCVESLCELLVCIQKHGISTADDGFPLPGHFFGCTKGQMNK